MKTRTVLLGGLGFCLGFAASGSPASPPPAPAFGTDAGDAPQRFSLFGTDRAQEREKVRETPVVVDRKKAAREKEQAAELEASAKGLGVTPAELKRLRELGYADSETFTQLDKFRRAPRDLIIEREILSDVSKALAEVSPRVYKLPADRQAAERERSMRDALSRIRRDRKASKDEMRRVLANTSFFTPDELKRVLGAGLFGSDDIKQVVGTRLFGTDTERDDKVIR